MLKPHLREETLEFLKTIPKSLYPHAYIELRHRTIRQSIKYLLSILLVAYFIMLAIGAPKLIYLSTYLDNQLTKFERLNFKTDIATSSPIVITEKNPMIVITTLGNISNITYNKLLITDNKIYFRESFSKIKEINYRDYLDVLGKKDTIRKLVVAGFYLMIPTVVFLLYFISLIKYSIIIFSTSIIAYLVTRLVKYEVTLRESITSGIYAATIMILLEIVTFPLQLSSYLLVIPVYAGISIAIMPLAAFLTIYIISIILISGKFVVLGR